jgi:alkanesulfonate monooxygenase SsuD/methylene tetrahydromethanopterin reductase-like flavin-dependent oxidoreductase (luciferase family)
LEIPIISALDLVAVRQGKTPSEAIARSVELAQHIEKLGYHRFWAPEHRDVGGPWTAPHAKQVCA